MKWMKRFSEIVVVTIATVYPLVGVMWLGWDIGDTIFVYVAEAVIVCSYHAVLYWRTRRLFTDPDLRKGYETTAGLRVGTEASIAVIALMIFIDFTVGRHVAGIFHVDSLGSYLVSSLIPIGSLLLHYGQRIVEKPQRTIILPIWWWLLHFPLPLFVCSYILFGTSSTYLVHLLLVVVTLKAIAEYRLIKPLPELSEAPRDLTVLTGHPYAHMNIVRRALVYLFVLVGMMSINPFFADPRYTMLQNVFIFLGFVAIWLPLARLPRVSLQLKGDTIYWEQLGWLKLRRTIPLADITNVKGLFGKQARSREVGAYLFTIKHQRSWRLGPFYLLRADWSAWLKKLQAAHPELNIPYL